MRTNKVSICIVNFNALDQTLACVKSIESLSIEISREIILVDNASSGSSVDALRQEFPKIRFIINSRNLGFASANNQAMGIAAGEYFLLLNNDTVLKNDAIGAMAAFLAAHPKAGAVTCKLFDADGSTIQKNCRSFPGPMGTMFGRASLLTKVFPNNPWSSKNLLSNWDYDSPRQVDWVSGAAIMIRREVFTRVGGLDDKTFFMYWEDTDWCKRIRDAGWEIWFTPDGQIIHYSGQGGGRRSLWMRLFTMYHMHRSAYLYFRKNYYPNPLHPMAIFLFLGMVSLIAIKTPLELYKSVSALLKAKR